MRILLTNDDGYMAPGLRALYEGLASHHDVRVAAPDRERSAVGMGITLINPLRAWDMDHTGMVGWGINGTPADCVKLALSELLEEKPDLVVSGINQGTNVGLNANYSGTVAGAVEAALNGLPGLAVSLLSFTSRDFEGAVRVTRRLVERIAEVGMERFELLNVNVPALPADELKGIRVAPVSHALFREVVEKRYDTREKEYYWLGGRWADLGEVEDGDHAVTMAGYAAVTPLHADWTARRSLQRMRADGWDEAWNGREG